VLKSLPGGIVVGLGNETVPAGHLEMFQEVVDQLPSLYKVRLDERRFTETRIEGPGWTSTHDHIRGAFAIRVIRGVVSFVNRDFERQRVSQTLRPGDWLFDSACAGFTMTTGKAATDYPCAYVVAAIELRK
jgi:hypothetical protein